MSCHSCVSHTPQRRTAEPAAEETNAGECLSRFEEKDVHAFLQAEFTLRRSKLRPHTAVPRCCAGADSTSMATSDFEPAATFQGSRSGKEYKMGSEVRRAANAPHVAASAPSPSSRHTYHHSGTRILLDRPCAPCRSRRGRGRLGRGVVAATPAAAIRCRRRQRLGSRKDDGQRRRYRPEGAVALEGA